jgi:hypothetical protein
MSKHLRPLALINIAIAVAFLMPVCFWAIAENLSSGNLMVTFPKIDRTAEDLAEIQTTTDIERLRHRAKVLTEMRDFDRETREVDTQVTKRLFDWFWILMGSSGVAFLLNAGAIWWVSKRPQRA